MDKYYVGYDRRSDAIKGRVPASLLLVLSESYGTESEAIAVARALGCIWQSYKFRVLKQLSLDF